MAVLLFFMYFMCKAVKHCTEKEQSLHLCNLAPKQLHADEGQVKQAVLFDFCNSATKLQKDKNKECLALLVFSVFPSEQKQKTEFSKLHATATALSFNCGWSSKPCSSFDRGKVNWLHKESSVAYSLRSCQKGMKKYYFFGGNKQQQLVNMVQSLFYLWISNDYPNSLHGSN